MAYEDQKKYYTTANENALILRTTGRNAQRKTHIYFTRVRKSDNRVIVYKTGRTTEEGMDGFDFDAATASDSGNKLGYVNFTKDGDKNFVVTGKNADGEDNINLSERSFFSSTKGIKKIQKSGEKTVKIDLKHEYEEAGVKITGAEAGEKAKQAVQEGVVLDPPEESSSDAEDEEDEEGDESVGTRTKGFPSLLSYPETLKSSSQDRISFTLLKYKPRKRANTSGDADASGLGFADRDRDLSKDALGQVILPIPGGISDSINVDWEDGQLNPMQVLGVDIGTAAATGGDMGKVIKDKVNNLKSSGKIKAAAADYFISQAVSTDYRKLISRTQGRILNPNMELLFNGPRLRDFDFEFKMSARSDSEGKQIIQIIKFFKQAMAPQISKTRFFLKTPLTFQIEYQDKDSGQQKYLNKFKEAALKGCTVNYTPDGNYSTYENGMMVSYSLRLSFSELQPIYNHDYGNGTFSSETGIGF